VKTHLLVKDGPSVGLRIEPTSDTLIGRVEADVALDDPKISRRHAILRSGQRGIEIEDLSSTNGTWVNGQRIEARVLLTAGDLVKVGDTRLEVIGEPVSDATVIASGVQTGGGPDSAPLSPSRSEAVPAVGVPPEPPEPSAAQASPARLGIETAPVPTAGSRLRGSVASRRPMAAIASMAVVVLTAGALIAYFAFR
jgi:predicted component of type VI protein secretion system